jgi:hypothetical protein
MTDTRYSRSPYFSYELALAHEDVRAELLGGRDTVELLEHDLYVIRERD